jgi:hypothetical protein
MLPVQTKDTRNRCAESPAGSAGVMPLILDELAPFAQGGSGTKHSSRELLAVLDFGDLTAGDPATDLAAAWLVFDPIGRAAFRDRVERLRATDAADWARARGWALAIGSAIVDTVGTAGPIGRVGAHALEQVLLD